MSVFDNKLINYGNLAEFHSKIIDDSSVSNLATWSSQLINNELADKQDVLTAGAGIDISNGIISATGGGGSVDMMVEVTYAQLKTLRDNSQLVPGQQYRITDYITTTSQANTQSAGHQFDIIVVADSEDKLNENARAIQHSGDTYFANCKLESWELKYCLDNDTSRFAWADVTNGKGVIYYMKDEWNNECPYDFKNIQFQRWEVTAYTDVPALVVDGEDNYYGYYYGAKNLSGINVLNATYGSNSGWFFTFALKDLASGEWYDYTIVNVLGLKDDTSNEMLCYGNKLNEAKDKFNSGKGNVPIVLNNMVFFNCYTDLSDTSYADDYSNCYNNSFGNACYDNTFGNGCYNNTFGNECYGNTFDSCQSNTFGNNCIGNTLGGCRTNMFGNNCAITFGGYLKNSMFGNNINSNFTTNYSTSTLKYINVLSGYDLIGDVPSGIVLNANYPQIVGKNSQGVFTVKNPLD